MVVEAVGRALAQLGIEGRRVLVAVSGGIDSMVLLDALATLAGARGLELVVGHVNHGLRGEDSEADARAVALRASELGLAHHSEHVDPGELRVGQPNRTRPTLQEAARSLRYRALSAMAERSGAHHIATAHQLDDQAETVLMRLLRGTGPEGLGGIPEQSEDGRIIRPLLAVSREAIEAYALERGLSWREDASNESDRYTRNRLRRHWIPALAEEFNPQLLRAIGNVAEAQRRESEWLRELVDETASRVLTQREGGIEIDASAWKVLHEALARRLAQRALSLAGGGRDQSRVHIERMLAFLRGETGTQGGAVLELPGGLRLVRAPGHFLLSVGEV